MNKKKQEEEEEERNVKKRKKNVERVAYFDKRDEQFDACIRLQQDLLLLETREEKRNLIRARMDECYLIFIYVFYSSLSFGPLKSSSALDDCDDFEVESTTTPQSLFQYFDILQEEGEQREREEQGEEDDDEGDTESDAARCVCAWLREHSNHGELVRAILDHDTHAFHVLFGPLVSYYSLESALRWWQKKTKGEELHREEDEMERDGGKEQDLFQNTT